MIDKILAEDVEEEKHDGNSRAGGIKRKKGGEAFDIDTSDIKA